MTMLLNIPITTANSATATTGMQTSEPPLSATIKAVFTYGSGGTSADAYVQTSTDGGGTWNDVANFHFTTSSAQRWFNLSALTPVTSIATPTDGSLTANTSVDDLLGNLWRCKYSSVGTYAASTTLRVDMIVRGRLTSLT